MRDDDVDGLGIATLGAATAAAVAADAAASLLDAAIILPIFIPPLPPHTPTLDDTHTAFTTCCIALIPPPPPKAACTRPTTNAINAFNSILFRKFSHGMLLNEKELKYTHYNKNESWEKHTHSGDFSFHF